MSGLDLAGEVVVFPAGVTEVGYFDIDREFEFFTSVEHYFPFLHVEKLGDGRVGSDFLLGLCCQLGRDCGLLLLLLSLFLLLLQSLPQVFLLRLCQPLHVGCGGFVLLFFGLFIFLYLVFDWWLDPIMLGAHTHQSLEYLCSLRKQLIFRYLPIFHNVFDFLS